MLRERTYDERVTDDAVLLVLWARAQERCGEEAAGDRLKLMKLAFVAAYRLHTARVKALNLRFYRWRKGPMSNQVSASWTDLVTSRHMIEDEEFVVTEQGVRLADQFRSEVLELPENRYIASVLDEVGDKFGCLPTDEVLGKVYEMRCYTVGSPGIQHRIGSIKQGTDIIDLLEAPQAEQVLQVPAGWEMTLDLAFDPDAMWSLNQGVADFHEGRVLTHAQMWAPEACPNA